MITLTTKQKLFIARSIQTIVMGIRGIFKAGEKTIAKRNKITWQLDLREGIDFSIWLLGAFEVKTQKQYLGLLKPGNIVIDVGANIGAHTLPLAAAVGSSGRIIAIEPTDYAFAKLTANSALNQELQARILAIQAMLTDQVSGLAAPEIYSSWPLKNEGDIHPLHGGSLKTCKGAKVTTLDAVVREINLEHIEIMKIDIDGYECAMLRGARETLQRYRPVIVMELAPYVLEEHGGSVDEIVDILKSLNYSIKDADTDVLLPLDGSELRDLIPFGAGRNIIAIPG
jgi:FkbM family methyltransferase